MLSESLLLLVIADRSEGAEQESATCPMKSRFIASHSALAAGLYPAARGRSNQAQFSFDDQPARRLPCLFHDLEPTQSRIATDGLCRQHVLG
jgi:hypothetical protein